MLHASNIHLETLEFAQPGACKELYCQGRACAKCGKCRDWYYIGDRESWKWIQSWRNWEDDDWKLWDDDHVWGHFKKRTDGATCCHNDYLRYAYYHYRDDDHYRLYRLYTRDGYVLGCVCDGNART